MRCSVAIEVRKVDERRRGSDPASMFEIRFLFDESLPAVFRGNACKLRQVRHNLMENAIKFTEGGRIDLR